MSKTATLLTAVTAAIVVACRPAPQQSLTSSPAPVAGQRPPAAPPSPGPVAPPLAVPGALAAPPEQPGSGPPASSVSHVDAPRWKVRSILVSADRRLALVDGRIVGPGDRVGGDTVVQISERAIVFADATGLQRRVQLWEERAGVFVK